MTIFLCIVFFLLGFALRDIIIFIYNIIRKVKQADEILEQEKKRRDFKTTYDFSDSFEDEENRK